MTRILHLLPHVQNRGNGTVNVAVDLAYLQAKAGYDVTVAAQRPTAGYDAKVGAETNNYRRLLESAGVKFIEFPHPKSAASILRSPFRFRRLIKTVRPDIVHAHIVTGILLGALLRFGSKYKLIASLHSEFRRSAVLMGLADHIISVSASSAATLERRGIGRGKISVIENAPLNSPRTSGGSPGQTSNGAAPRAPASNQAGDSADDDFLRPSIATVAGLTYRKGIDVLLDAFEIVHRDFPQANLYIIGQGPDREAFLAQTRALGARERIHFLGFRSNPRPYLSATDIFVLASRREPFGLVIVEARAAGCAIVASDVDGIPEALEGGRCGLMVPPGEPASLAETLRTLLADPALLADWKRKASVGLERFDVARLHRETLEVYARV